MCVLSTKFFQLHGRSREQRYTRSADWDYIDKCAKLADPVPLFGNGDILSFEDYNIHRENTSVAGMSIDFKKLLLLLSNYTFMVTNTEVDG